MIKYLEEALDFYLGGNLAKDRGGMVDNHAVPLTKKVADERGLINSKPESKIWKLWGVEP